MTCIASSALSPSTASSYPTLRTGSPCPFMSCSRRCHPKCALPVPVATYQLNAMETSRARSSTLCRIQHTLNMCLTSVALRLYCRANKIRKQAFNIAKVHSESFLTEPTRCDQFACKSPTRHIYTQKQDFSIPRTLHTRTLDRCPVTRLRYSAHRRTLHTCFPSSKVKISTRRSLASSECSCQMHIPTCQTYDQWRRNVERRRA